MSADRIAIPLPDGRWLVLDAATFAAGIAAGEVYARRADAATTVTAQPAGELLTAEQMSARTGVDASWYLAQARLRNIPHVKLGKYVRFDFAAVAAAMSMEPGMYQK